MKITRNKSRKEYQEPPKLMLVSRSFAKSLLTKRGPAMQVEARINPPHKALSPQPRVIFDLRYQSEIVKIDREIRSLIQRSTRFANRIREINSLVIKPAMDHNETQPAWLVKFLVARASKYVHQTTAEVHEIRKRIAILAKRRIGLVRLERKLHTALQRPIIKRSYIDPEVLAHPTIAERTLRWAFYRLQPMKATCFYLWLLDTEQTEEQILAALHRGGCSLNIYLEAFDPDHPQTPETLRQFQQLLKASRLFRRTNQGWTPKADHHDPNFQKWLTSSSYLNQLASVRTQSINLARLQAYEKRRKKRYQRAATIQTNTKGRPQRIFHRQHGQIITSLLARGASIDTIAVLLYAHRNTIYRQAAREPHIQNALTNSKKKRGPGNQSLSLPHEQTPATSAIVKSPGRPAKRIEPQIVEELIAKGFSIPKVAVTLHISRGTINRNAQSNADLKIAIAAGRARYRQSRGLPPKEPKQPEPATSAYCPNFQITQGPGRPCNELNHQIIENLLAHGLSLAKTARVLRTSRGTIYRQAETNIEIQNALKNGRDRYRHRRRERKLNPAPKLILIYSDRITRRPRSIIRNCCKQSFTLEQLQVHRANDCLKVQRSKTLQRLLHSDLSFKEIAARLNLTPTRIRQLAQASNISAFERRLAIIAHKTESFPFTKSVSQKSVDRLDRFTAILDKKQLAYEFIKTTNGLRCSTVLMVQNRRTILRTTNINPSNPGKYITLGPTTNTPPVDVIAYELPDHRWLLMPWARRNLRQTTFADHRPSTRRTIAGSPEHRHDYLYMIENWTPFTENKKSANPSLTAHQISAA